MRSHVAIGSAAVAVAIVVTACGGSSDDAPASTLAPSTTATPAPSTTATTQVPAPSTTAGVPTTTTTAAPAEPPLAKDGENYTITWASVTNPLWDPNAGSDADPFFFIHTQPDVDGFFFSLEMFTTGYGALWQGELGDVDIICDEAAPAPNSTGICPHFDPDGSGPIGDLNADFAATGSITINQLDAGGYDITVNEIAFSDGSTIGSFEMTGP
ncbi:MAG: hypothetical protein BMS9Abin07_1595 [Acidimicrobiia bacterium]|nr:MAG: hypothetical protein BMS9Abin07_1595 [Acidimicrobiia bacterium]